jgi:hypothetical protein
LWFQNHSPFGLPDSGTALIENEEKPGNILTRTLHGKGKIRDTLHPNGPASTAGIQQAVFFSSSKKLANQAEKHSDSCHYHQK